MKPKSAVGIGTEKNRNFILAFAGTHTTSVTKTRWRAFMAASCLTAILATVAVSSRAEDSAAANKKSAETKVKEAPPVKLEQVEARPVHRGVTYGGALRDIAKSDQPLQVINPWAPKRYGSGETNQVRDPVTKQARGVALFSLRW